MANGYFWTFNPNNITDNTHAAVITLAPEPGLGDRKDEALKEELWLKASLSDEEVAAFVEQTQQLRTSNDSRYGKKILANYQNSQLKISTVWSEATPINSGSSEGKTNLLTLWRLQPAFLYVKYYSMKRARKRTKTQL